MRNRHFAEWRFLLLMMNWNISLRNVKVIVKRMCFTSLTEM